MSKVNRFWWKYTSCYFPAQHVHSMEAKYKHALGKRKEWKQEWESGIRDIDCKKSKQFANI